MTQLQHLDLSSTDVDSPKPEAYNSFGMDLLLQLLHQLHQLRHLSLFNACRIGSSSDEAAYSALTRASSQLTYLDISSDGSYGMRFRLPEADGAWDHMFPPSGCQLPQLRVLLIGYIGFDEDDELLDPLLDARHVHQLVRCCPELRELDIRDDMQPGEGPGALKHLTDLSMLSKLPVADVSDEEVGVLAQLTGLRELSLQHCAEECLNPVGLLQLTLSGSPETIDTPGLGNLRWCQDNGVRQLAKVYENQAPEGHPPGVYLLLLWAGTGAPECQTQQLRQQAISL